MNTFFLKRIEWDGNGSEVVLSNKKEEVVASHEDMALDDNMVSNKVSVN